MIALYLGQKCIGDNRIDGLEALDVEATVELNASSSLIFTLPPTNEYCGQLPLMNKSEEIKLEIDGEFVFIGRVTKAQQNFDKSFDYECEGSRAYLNDVTLPVYSTSDDDVPDSLDGLFAWYVNHYNQRVQEQHQFTIGKNQAYLLRENNKVVRSSTQRPTVWAEIKEKLIDALGGWVRVRYEGDKRYIDYLVTPDHSTTQRVEFGENLLDYARTQDMINYCTRLIPIGATPEGSDSNITIESLSDGFLETGFYKMGNAIINQEAERKYGVIECVENFSDITLPENLQSAGLRSLISKQINDVIEINAVDLARLGVEDPINAGDYVRVISKPHSIDEYFICQKRTYHEDASQDTFQLGSEISNLTGKQTENINRLNASINKVYEKVDINTEDIKSEVTEVKKSVEKVDAKADTAQAKADSVKDIADSAESKADEAKKESQNASAKADSAKESADNASVKADNAQESANNASAKADSATEKAEQASSKADEASSKADDARKYADNYMSFDKATGLVIGNQEEINKGCSTHITSDKVALYDKDTEVASFTATGIDLAKNSGASKVTFGKGSGVLQADTSSVTMTHSSSSAHDYKRISLSLNDSDHGVDSANVSVSTYSPVHGIVAGMEVRVKDSAKFKNASVSCYSNSMRYINDGSLVWVTGDHLVFNDGDIYGGETLTTSSDISGVRVSKKLSEYDYIEVFYKSHTNLSFGDKGSIKLDSVSNGTTFTLTVSGQMPSASVCQFVMCNFIYNESTLAITPQLSDDSFFNIGYNGNYGGGLQNHGIVITKVVGYR